MIKVFSAGLYTTIQDVGRFGHRASGVPVSGAMDFHSYQLANQIVENPYQTAMLEYTAVGPTLEFTVDCELVITGAKVLPTINNVTTALNLRIKVSKGDILKIGRVLEGVRGYISFRGGITSEIVLGSKSMYNDITSISRLEKDAILKLDSTPKACVSNVKKPLDFSINFMEVFKGPEFDFLPSKIKNKIEHLTFKINSNSNRMAYMLDTDFDVQISEIISAPVQPGTIQLTPSGNWIVLMRDAQTTGGYGRIFQLSENSISLLSQKRAGEQIRVKLIDNYDLV